LRWDEAVVDGDRVEEVKPGIQERSFAFAVRILKLTRALPRDVGGQIVARQIGRCGTGIGSNVEEAQGAQTRKEFARKMNIARGEALETRYWLRLIAEVGILPREHLESLLQESDELVRILVTIVKKTRENDARHEATSSALRHKASENAALNAEP
jgi:four helix bundle protein